MNMKLSGIIKVIMLHEVPWAY